MKIFITGGTGFIGRPLVYLLKNRHDVLLLVPDNKNVPKGVNTIQGNLQDLKKWQAKLKRFDPQICVHLAWEGLPDHHYSISKKNLDYGLNLFELLTKTNCKKILATGSGWEYGAQPGRMSENTLPVPLDPHTAVKHSLRMIGSDLAKENNITFIWARLFFVYGPGQRDKALIPYMLSCFDDGNVPEIRNPNAKNDFVFVEDVASALYKLLTKVNKSDTFNVGSGKLTSVSYIVDYLCKLYGVEKKTKKVRKQPQDKIGSAYADISKIKKVTGWEPTISIDEGIQKTVKVHKSQL